MSLKYIFDPGGTNELVLTEAEIVSHNPVRTHTGLSDLSATIIEDRTLDSYAQRQDRLNVEVNGNVKWTGYVVGLSHNIGQGRSRLRAEGIAKRLKETRPDYDSLNGSLTYSNISLEDALDDYWARTPFTSYSVTPQSTEIVAQDTVLQEADTNTEFGNVTSIASDDPVVIQNGQLELSQTAFFVEAEDADGQSQGIFNDPDASDEFGEQLVDGIDDVEQTVSFDHAPSSGLGAAARIRSGDTDASPAFEITIDGNQVFSAGNDAINNNTDFAWFFGTDASLTSAGSHDMRVSVTNATATEGIIVDCIVLYDTRYHSAGFDNTVDSNFALSTPTLYPSSQTVTFTEEEAGFNITEAALSLTIDDTSGAQSLALSFDSGSTYTTGNNTDTLTAQPADSSRTAQARVTLSQYDNGQTTTPTTGNAGQKIDVETLTADLNDTVVIDQLELSRNHFENLQQLHEYGGWNWTIEHDASTVGNMTVKSYQPGDETRTKPAVFADPISENAEVQAESYFNSIFLQGAKDSSGDRPTAEEKDSTRISNDGREISPGVLRDLKVTTQAGARFRALSLLETALSNNELVGEKTLPSDTLIDPGYAYPVDFGNGDVEKTLEEVSLTESPKDVNIRARFSTPRSDLSAQIEDLQRQGRDRGDNV